MPAKHRGQRVARALCAAAADHALLMRHDGEPIESLHLWFPRQKQEALQPLYTACGFEVVGESRFESSSFGDEIVVMRRML